MNVCKHGGNMGFVDKQRDSLKFVWVVLVAFLVTNGVVYVHLLVNNGDLSARLREVEGELHSYRSLVDTDRPTGKMPEDGRAVERNSDPIDNKAIMVQKRSYRTEPREEKAVISAPALVIHARLVDGETSNEGRLEVRSASGGEWGSICNDRWDMKDANVVCRQMGYRGAVPDTEDSFFGEGRGKIWLDEVICAGTESNLAECKLPLGWGIHNCGHDEDVGVVCAGVNECAAHRCRNHATCVGIEEEEGYRCLCAPGFHGKHCEHSSHRRHQTTSGQASLLSVHIPARTDERTTSAIIPVKEGIFTQWDYHQEPGFEFEGGHLGILEPGKYFVYSQVEFAGDEADAGSKYSIRVGETPFLSCTLPVEGIPPQYTCYTGGMLDLKYGDKVYIYVETKETCNIGTEADRTYFGAIKLSAKL